MVTWHGKCEISPVYLDMSYDTYFSTTGCTQFISSHAILQHSGGGEGGEYKNTINHHADY